MKGTTIFELDPRAFDEARAIGATLVRTPWKGGDPQHIAHLAQLCKSYAMRPCLVYDGLESLTESQIQSKVKAASSQLSTLVARFDVQCGVEIQSPDQVQPSLALAKKIAGWTYGYSRFAPPILCMNTTLGWCLDAIRSFYGGSVGSLKPTFDFYMDHSGGIADEIETLDRVERAFQDCGYTYKDLSVMEYGMKGGRKGKLDIKDAFNRTEGALIRSRFPLSCQFAIMDGLVGDDSYGRLNPDYSKSPLGLAV